ncbi:MAG TPA: pilin [Candidatus Paceibacterota bacterium]
MINDFESLIKTIVENIFNPLVGLILTLALVYFLWGIVKYLQSVGDETKRQEGIKMMTYGIIALFVMVSVWGLVNVLKKTFPLDYDTPTRPPIPASPVSG